MPDTDKKTILVVDDDREIVRAISITLEREGYLSLIHISEPTSPY